MYFKMNPDIAMTLVPYQLKALAENIGNYFDST